MVERLITAITTWDGWLRATIRRVGRTLQAYVDVVVMPIPGTHLGHPRFVVLVLDTAELFFNCGIDQDSLDFGLLGCCSDEGDIGRTPNFVIDVLSVRCNHVAR
jgi:hypothetical protein